MFGGCGLVGSRLLALNQETFAFTAPTHADLDVTDEAALRGIIRQLEPQQIVYATGFARMDAAESQPDEAILLNDTVPGWIAEEAGAGNIPFHYLSTNAVFSGEQPGMRTEDEQPDPKSVYGKSKYDGERTVLSASSKNSVLRLISVYSAHHPARVDFARRIIAQLRNGESVQGITDMLFNPLFADCAARAIGAVLQAHGEGVYHLGATDEISNMDFTRLLARAAKLDESAITPVTYEAFRNSRVSAPYGPHQSLNTEKFRNAFGNDILMTNEQSVETFISRLTSTS